ncbi:MAG: hypothetical protein JWQ64_2297 [Subtercola sp.]|nr:hypothetical protein [Subtercola sp.]
MAKPVSYGLGFGRGSIIDLGGGLIEYRATGKLLPAFRVNVADVTGFAVRRPGRLDKGLGASSLQQIFALIGGGTELAACAVNYGTSEMIEAWIRAQPSFGKSAPRAVTTRVGGVQNTLPAQLAQLAQLRDAGVLSLEDFERAKTKLLS